MSLSTATLLTSAPTLLSRVAERGTRPDRTVGDEGLIRVTAPGQVAGGRVGVGGSLTDSRGSPH